LGKVAGTVRSAKMFGTNKGNQNITGYMGDSNNEGQRWVKNYWQSIKNTRKNNTKK
jgi:hypothetical protein